MLNYKCYLGWDTRWQERHCCDTWDSSLYLLVNLGRTTRHAHLSSALLPLGSKIAHEKHKFSYVPPFLKGDPSWSTMLGLLWTVCPLLGFSEQALLHLNPCLPTWLLSVLKVIFWLSSLLFVLFFKLLRTRMGKRGRSAIWGDTRGDSNTMGQCGPVSIFQFLTLSKPLANYYGMWLYLNF